MQPTRTEFGIRRHIKGWQRSGNFGHDRPIFGKMGAETSPMESEVFCVVNQMTFWQLCNGRFPPNLFTNCISASRHRIRKDIFENFHFRGHFPPKSEIKNRSQAPHSEQPTVHGMHCREMLFTPRCSPRATEFPRSGKLFSTMYSCGAMGCQSCPIFGFWPIFPVQNP